MADEPLETESTADCWAGTKATSPCAAELQTDNANTSAGRANRFASFGALLSAFIASSWCWLPPLLILGGVSGAGMTTFAEEYRPIFMAVTIGLLGWAFYVTYRSSVRSKVMTFNKVILWAITGVAVVMLFFPAVVTDFVARGDRITADMDRTVISIEGMT